MMRLVDEEFRTLTGCLVSSPFLSRVGLDKALEEFGGGEGVVMNSYYISAWEAIGRELAFENTPEEILVFFEQFESLLNTAPEYMYYFVESVVGESLVRGAELEMLMVKAPEAYKSFLMKRYGSK